MEETKEEKRGETGCVDHTPGFLTNHWPIFTKIRAGAAAGQPDTEETCTRVKLPSFPVSPGRVFHHIEVDKLSHTSAFTQRDGTQRTQHHLNGFVPTQISEEEMGVVPQQEGIR